MRFGSDLDYYDWLNGPYVTCTCLDCGADFREPFDAPQTICVECCDRRDAHTTALQERLIHAALTQLKAALPEKRLKEIA